MSAVTDPEGVVTHYDYDLLHRQVATQILRGSANGLKTTNVLDAAGRVLVTQRLGAGDTLSQRVTIQQYSYDILGQVLFETNALGGFTTHAYSLNSGGGRHVVTSYPDGGTRLEDYYRDGRLETLTGTAVAPAQYEYGMDPYEAAEYATETKLDGSGNPTSEATTTYTDGSGRAYKTVYAASNGAPSKQSWYNTGGQLWKERDPDGVVKLYDYNAQGELEYSPLT